MKSAPSVTNAIKPNVAGSGMTVPVKAMLSRSPLTPASEALIALRENVAFSPLAKMLSTKARVSDLTLRIGTISVRTADKDRYHPSHPSLPSTRRVKLTVTLRHGRWIILPGLNFQLNQRSSVSNLQTRISDLCQT